MLAQAANGSVTDYYVRPDIPDSCAGYSPCEALQHYASYQQKYFTNDTSFTFLSGTHILSGSISIYDVKNVILTSHTNAKIMCNDSGGLIFKYVTKIHLANLSFIHCGQPLPESLQRDGETAQAALAFGEVTDLLLESVSVSYSTGYGLLGHCVHGNFTITHSDFSFNNGSSHYLGGNAAVEYTNCSQVISTRSKLTIFESIFANGNYEGYDYTSNYTGTLATGLMLILSQTNLSVYISDVIMENNTNNIQPQGFGGNLFVHFFNKTNYTGNVIKIKNSKFINGRSWIGGGISISFFTASNNNLQGECKNMISIHNTSISQNKGIIGSGLYVNSQINNTDQCPFHMLTVSNCTFESNALLLVHTNKVKFTYVGNGVAVHIINTYPDNQLVQQVPGHFEALFEDTTFENNHAAMEGGSPTKLTVLGMTFVIANAEQVNIRNSQFVSNAFTALGGYRTKIALSGNIIITNNTGINGGGLMLCESSYIILSNNTIVSFVNNSAIQSGGAIYIENECLRSKPFCFFQLTPNNKNCNYSEISQTVSITMTNNTAGYAGDHIYGGALDNCYITICASSIAFHSLFKIQENDLNTHPSAVTSDPRKICFCVEGKRNCTIEILDYKEAKHPGSHITVCAVIVGQFDGTVPGTILPHIQNSNLNQVVFTTGKFCTLLNIQILSEETDHVTVDLQLPVNLISSGKNITYFSMSEPRKISVRIAPCPLGFNHSNNTCTCDQILQFHEVDCDIEHQHIYRTPPAWIGYINKGESRRIVFHEVCPYNYCLDTPVIITSDNAKFDQDSQCAPNRTGLLCSKCQDGFSLSVGTSDCLKCEEKVAVPLYIFGFAIFGIMLVFFLVVFNVTYTEGNFSGLLFYANIVNLNSSIFFPPKQNNILYYFISWMNLDSGFKFCFYNGMNAYAKSWLSFCFPTYIFLIAGIIVFLCRKSDRIAQIFSGNIIKVLATLFQLSYASLIQSVVAVLSFTELQYPPSTNNSAGRVHKLVWLADPSLEYFHGKHIPLALVAIVFGLLILTYTLVLLFIQPLQRYSHLRCFSWVAKLKPLIDAYTAPHIIKDNCRYWEGLLLLFRLLLAVIFTANIKSRININLTAISTVSLLLLTTAWSTSGVYNKAYLNILNSISVLNLAVLSIALSDIFQNSLNYQMQINIAEHEPPYYKISTSISFGIEFLISLAVLANGVYRKMKMWYLKCRRKKYQTFPCDIMPPMRQFPFNDQ